MYSVTLSKTENVKIKSGIFSQVLRFEYHGDEFSFNNFVGVKPALKVIEEEIGKGR